MTAKRALSLYRGAVLRADQLEQAVRALASDIIATQQSNDLTPAAKTTRIQQLRADMLARVRADRVEITQMLNDADDAARDALSGDPADTVLQTRKSRAIPRVSRLLDTGQHIGQIAQVFVDAEDLDALRALRDEVPAYVAASSGDIGRDARLRATTQLTLALDELMRPLLPADEQLVVDVRVNADNAKAFVDNLAEWTTTVGLNGLHAQSFHSYVRPVAV